MSELIAFFEEHVMSTWLLTSLLALTGIVLLKRSLKNDSYRLMKIGGLAVCSFVAVFSTALFILGIFVSFSD